MLARSAAYIPEGCAAPKVLMGDCLSELKRGRQGKELGRGEQGVVFNIEDDARHVLKITPLKDAATEAKWLDESCISEILGKASIGPSITQFWICEDKEKRSGFIVMQRIKDIRKVIDKEKTGIDHISLCPPSILMDYVHKLEAMIDMGYIHMDNHPGNLGFTEDGTGILFDFGFTIRRKGLTLIDKLYALGFSIGQIIEHTPLAEIKACPLYDILISINQGTYVWGSGVPGRIDKATFERANTIKPTATIHTVLKTISDTTPSYDFEHSVYIGFRLYCMLLLLEREDRYDFSGYAVIYDIRNGTIKGDGASVNASAIKSANNAATAAARGVAPQRSLRQEKGSAAAGASASRGGRRLSRRARTFRRKTRRIR